MSISGSKGVSLFIKKMPNEITNKYWYTQEQRGTGYIIYPINEKGRMFVLLSFLLIVGWFILILFFNVFPRNYLILFGGELAIMIICAIFADVKTYISGPPQNSKKR